MNKKQRLERIERGCTRIHSGVAWLGLIVMLAWHIEEKAQKKSEII